jgi:flagellar biosynthesis/type III secretory pathway protein FliH
MTAVHPPRLVATLTDAELAAYADGHQAATDTAYTDGFEQGRAAGWDAGYAQALRDIAGGDPYQAGRAHGYTAALHDIAVRAAELDIAGLAADRRVRSQAAANIRARREQHEERARQLYELHGRQEYRGGPVPVWGGGEAA